MRTFAIVALLVPPFLPNAALSQDWTPEQREVWEFELGCQESKEAWLACFHEDYVAWADMSLSVPHTKADHEVIGARAWDDNEQVFVHLKPVAITVRGDVAVALVVYTNSVRNRATGEVVTTTQAWTDVCIRENGRWYWIADHGTPVGEG